MLWDWQRINLKYLPIKYLKINLKSNRLEIKFFNNFCQLYTAKQCNKKNYIETLYPSKKVKHFLI